MFEIILPEILLCWGVGEIGAGVSQQKKEKKRRGENIHYDDDTAVKY